MDAPAYSRDVFGLVANCSEGQRNRSATVATRIVDGAGGNATRGGAAGVCEPVPWLMFGPICGILDQLANSNFTATAGRSEGNDGCPTTYTRSETR
ncbi:hypothetical protein Pan189_42490 [Stratiformator vulcanicus]|uniref:Uncharacterized protein n=1 Tax=Stratiformator vulcanicus TaxID=2527980 RepID=A0A517R7G9_9PLAN|nr:hypothetical protein Pan189_42490 [Stratiformator vulcanicus]